MTDQPDADDRTVIKPPPKPAEDHGNALPPGTYLGEFELTKTIGEGGFGIVYMAWDHSLERRVALKEYMPSSLAARVGGLQVAVKAQRHNETFAAGLRSFVNEARLLAQFDHPSLVKVYRFWEANGTAYMVMPFYEGDTLKQYLDRHRVETGEPPGEAWLMSLLSPLTEALHVIHEEQCYHRDIAPDNIILLKGSLRPLLLDFGAARRVIGDMTQALTVILKPGYAPVEQYAEVPGMKQGGWTDVYALAASIYYAIVGKTPPPSVGRLMNDNFVSLAEAGAGRYSERFTAAIDRALIVKPELRTQSIAELRHDLGLEEGMRVAPAPAFPVDDDKTVIRPASPRPALASANLAPGAVPLPAGTPGTSGTGAGARQLDAPGAAAAGTAGANKLLLWGGAGLASLALVAGGAWMFKRPAATEPAPTRVAGDLTAVSPTAVSPTTGSPGSAAPTAGQAAGQTVPGTTPPPASTPGAGSTTGAVPPSAVPSAPPVPQGPVEPAREFSAILAAQTPGWSVVSVPNKPSFRIGKDRLEFTVTSAREGYVYVLLKSTDGGFMRFFPNTQAQNNRVNAGQALKLPGASWPLIVSGPKGTDQFLVIVSASKRDFAATGMQTKDWFGVFPTASAPAFSGPGSVFAGQPTCAASPCSQEYGAVGFAVDEI